MKHPKDRLHRVMVIGATPAGIAATNKLGELGIPVTLVDSDADLNQKLTADAWRLPSGLPFNYAHRPGLLRMLRNPQIRCILSARISSLKHMPQGFRARVTSSPTYIDLERCTLCGRCVDICPVVSPDGSRPIQLSGRGSLPGRPVIDRRKQPLCQEECPLGVNAQAYVALAGVGRFKEALEVVRRDNVLPGICGRICTHPCESSCRRGELDEPIAIRDIKRFVADYELSHPQESERSDVPQLEETVAVIGSGPAGLAAAADLARLGYGVTIYEREGMAGGLLRYGIGPHRLPRDILDYELDQIRRLGVDIETDHPVDLSGDMGELRRDVDAVILTVGTWSDRELGMPGEDLEGVEGCLSFLARLYRDEIETLPEKVAVIGDGNAAFDLARALKRLGADVTILSWFQEDMIPADAAEIRGAREEDITVLDRVRVVSFLGSNGRFDRVTCRPTQPGKPDKDGIAWPITVPGSESYELAFERAFVAIGQKGPFDDNRIDGKTPKLGLTPDGRVAVDDGNATNIQGVYAAGDAVTGASAVVQSMATGRAVARAVHADLSKAPLAAEETSRPADKDFPEIPADIPSLSRPNMPERQSAARKVDFREVALGFNEAQVIVEAGRCLQCGVCSECHLCSDVCIDVGAITHLEQAEESVEHAGAIIIADPKAAPGVKGEDVIRAYGPKAAKSDIQAMITRGFAAAGEAMVLLEGTSQRPRGRGIALSSPDPELSPDIRTGVFVCRCNASFGWLEGMDRYVAELTGREDIVHAEVLNAACVPEGSAGILRAIREKGITRAVLASCICCPLDFVCSACTDQRSRLKDTLFKGTGVSRSMVETCNLRGEVLRHLVHDESIALDRFIGLLDRSIIKASGLKQLPAPARNYNFTTAVIGKSEAPVNSARILAEAGLEVLMFGMPEGPGCEQLAHPNIHRFADTTVNGMSGTLGDFQIFAESVNGPQVLQVGAVIIGEKERRHIPYVPQKGLMGTRVAITTKKQGVSDAPFLHPGATSIAGLFLADPPGIRVSGRKQGAAAAALAAAVMPRGPRQSKGFPVVIDDELCRGCGRCHQVCPFQAITFHLNAVGGWCSAVDEALCKGCGNCISVCPSNAADSPYRNTAYLERTLEEILVR